MATPHEDVSGSCEFYEHLGVLLDPVVVELLMQLRSVHVDCWLDSGTLLGLVRDGQVPAWDKDTDIGAWRVDASQIAAVARDIARKYELRYTEKWLRGRPYAILLAPEGNTSVLPIAIHLFHRRGSLAISPQPHLYISRGALFPKKALAGTVDEQRHLGGRVFLENMKLVCCLLIHYLRLTRVFRFLIRVSQRRDGNGVVAVHPSERWLFAWLYGRFEWRVPIEHFLNLETFSSGKEYACIPSRADKYLRLRYGANWRVPQRHWFYVVDDAALHSERVDDNNLNGRT